MSETRAEIGARGEQEAIKYLRQNGFLIRDKNWRCGRYELDIVAEKWGVIHFVEVKTRTAGGWTTPEEAITKQKSDSLKRAVAAYLAQYRIRGEHQIDLIAIEMEAQTITEIRYIENAIQCSW